MNIIEILGFKSAKFKSFRELLHVAMYPHAEAKIYTLIP